MKSDSQTERQENLQYILKKRLADANYDHRWITSPRSKFFVFFSAKSHTGIIGS
jgi:hypothetical protein